MDTDLGNKKALILIDLQNEFLSPDGNFPIPHASELLENISQLLDYFREHCQEAPIVWVRAEYPPAHEDPSSAPRSPFNVLTGRHTGRKPCCYAGTSGAEFSPQVKALISETDVVITKTWYSAFKETNLDSLLKEQGVMQLFIAGLLSNVCVTSTATEATNIGYKVHVVESCLGWKRVESHRRALKSFLDLGIQVVASVEDLIHVEQVNLPTGPTIPSLYYVNGSIPSWRVLMALYEKGIQFEMHRRRVMSNPKETRTPDFLALNHRGKTPVFVDPTLHQDGMAPEKPVIVNESLAVLQYIETYHGHATPLLPPITNRTARALVLSRMQETENLHDAYDALEDAHFEAITDHVVLPDATRVPLAQAVHAELEYWEVYASKSDFIAGDTFTLADCAFFPLLGYMVHRGFNWDRPRYRPDAEETGDFRPQSVERDAWPSLHRYFDRVWTRGGSEGCARRAQPDGWDTPGRENVWTGKRSTSRRW